MKLTHSVLVAYGHDGFRAALSVVESLKSVAEVQLCSYDSDEQPSHEPDVALCIVTDQESLDQAHDFQVRLDDVPAVVVDGSGALKIEINGYAGRISSSPDQVLKTVQQLLATRRRNETRASRKEAPNTAHRRISSPFDHALARSAGGEQPPQAVLIAAARQLFWDLRAPRGEVFLRMVERNGFQKIYSEPEASGGEKSFVSPEVVRLIKRRPFPVTLHELEAGPARPLYDYLDSRHLNLLVPLVKESRLLGWLAFGLEDSRCTNEVLDDLQIIAHLLTISVAEAFDRELKKHDDAGLFEAFSTLRFGIITVNQEGRIVNIAGATTQLGSALRHGDHFKTIHNSRVREVIAHALRGRFVERTWADLDSQLTMTCLATKLEDGRFAIFWQPQQSREQDLTKHLDLKEVLESLPVPVLLDNEVTPGSVSCPQGRITDADCQAIRDCALHAQAKNVKALRLRWGKRRSPSNAVLFYETDINEGSEEFSDDIKHAVRFSLEAA
ncbi:MAG TPA: hypothetical protein VIT00_02420 [Terrimicrobiaceae bacterium]